MRTRLTPLRVAWTVVLWAGSAAAEADDEQRARALFEEARTFVEARNCTRAIPKLKESLSLRESIGAHLNLAQCYAVSNPAEAWREDKKAEDMAQAAGDDRVGFAREQARALEARIALVRIAMPASSLTLAGLSMRIDGAPLEARDRDRPFPVAAGTHTIEVSAPGKRTWNQTLTTALGSQALVVPVLEDSPPPPTLLPPSETAATPAQRGTDSGAAARRTVAYVLGAAALIGIGTGAYFGMRASSDWSHAKSLCGAGCASSSPAYDARDSAHAEGNASTVAFVAGGVALAAAIVFFVGSMRNDQPSKATARATPAADSGAASWLVGAF
jgi:hypothetical protein